MTIQDISRLQNGAKVYVKSSSDPRTTRLEHCRVRLVVIGGTAVGKSAITFRYLNDNFIPDHEPTIEDTWSNARSIDGVTVKVDILDTAGLGDFNNDVGNWVVEKDGVILVYDITNPKSFRTLTGEHAQIVEDFTDNCPPIIVLGNKKDLVPKTKNVIVKREDAEEWCRNSGVLFEETSAKTDERISESFVSIIRQHLKAQYPKVKGKSDHSKFCTIL